MRFEALTRRSLSLFAAIGGWRTVAEGVTSRALFLVAYLLTDRVLASALIAVGGVLVFTVVRVCTGQKYWQAAVGLAVVGVSALLAGSSGRAVDFYLPNVLAAAAGGVVLLLSMLVRWPLIGLAMGALRGERLGWRRDRALRRQYQLCTAMFVVKNAITTAVLAPLYLTGQVTALGLASTVLSAPATCACMYLCWRMPRISPVVRSGV